MKNFFKKTWKSVTFACVIALVLALVSPIGVSINSPPQDTDNVSFTIGQQEVVFTIGSDAVYAAGTADYTCDGTDDNVQFQAAMDALPVGGGKLIALAGDYSWANLTTVSRAIDNVTIQGMGSSSSFTGDGVTSLFSAGVQDGWTFRDFVTDASGITYLASTRYILENVSIGVTYHAYRTDATADEWEIPTGRGASFTVAASDSLASSKAQADYVCVGTDDQVQIQAAIDALPAGTGRHVVAGATIADGGTLLDQGEEANDPTINDMTLLPAIPMVNDAYYFGGYIRFDELTLNIGTAGVGTWTIVWEYYQAGGAWVALAGVSDGTSGFTVGGESEVTFTMPNDWTLTTLRYTERLMFELFWIRARVSVYTGITTQPLGTQGWIEVDTGGGSVNLSEGIFDVGANYLTIPSNVKLCGQGNSTEIKHTGWNAIRNADIVGGNQNILIADIAFDGQRDGGDDFLLGGIIHLVACSDSLLERVYLQEGLDYGLALVRCQRIKVSESLCSHNADDGFTTFDDVGQGLGGVDDVSETRDISYIGCTSLGHRYAGISSGFEFEKGARGISVVSCSIYDNSAGILIQKGTPYPEDITIANCQIHHNGQGIAFGDASTIAGQSYQIIGNHIYENSHYGIANVSGSVYGLIITGNIIEGIYTPGLPYPGVGSTIYLSGSASDVIITDNIICNSAWDGITLSHSGGNYIIASNRIYDVAYRGISIEPDDGGAETIQRIIISSNEISAVNLEASANDNLGSGIVVITTANSQVSDLTVSDNIIRDGRYGLVLSGNATLPIANILVDGNNLSGNTVGGFLETNTHLLTIANNFGYDNERSFDYDQNLVFYAPFWKLWNGADATPFVSSGLNSQKCTPTATTWSVLGLTFNGVNSIVTVDDEVSLQLGHVGTIEAWIYPTDITGYHCIVSKVDFNAERDGYGLFTNGDEIRTSLCSAVAANGNNTTTSPVIINTWICVGMVWDGTNIITYANGLAINSIAQTLDPKSDVYDLIIGNDAVYASFFEGIEGEVRISNYAKSPLGMMGSYLATEWRYP